MEGVSGRTVFSVQHQAKEKQIFFQMVKAYGKIANFLFKVFGNLERTAGMGRKLVQDKHCPSILKFQTLPWGKHLNFFFHTTFQDLTPEPRVLKPNPASDVLSVFPKITYLLWDWSQADMEGSCKPY